MTCATVHETKLKIIKKLAGSSIETWGELEKALEECNGIFKKEELSYRSENARKQHNRC